MSNYVPPDPVIVEKIESDQQAAQAQEERLKDAPPDVLRQMVRNRQEPAIARVAALGKLLVRRDPELGTILPEHFEDADLCHLAIRHCSLSEPRTRDRVRGLLDHARTRVWVTAATALARVQDEALFSRLTEWLEYGDRDHRMVALRCLREYERDEALAIVAGAWERAGGDLEDRLVLAETLLSLGDMRGLELLDETARQAKGAWAVFAAVTIAGQDKHRGLALMQEIADHGDLEAQRSLVNHAWNMAQIPNAFTAQGLQEARQWIERQLQKAS